MPKTLLKRQSLFGIALCLTGIGLAVFAAFWIHTVLDRRSDRRADHAQMIAGAPTIDGTIVSSKLDRTCDEEDRRLSYWDLDLKFTYVVKEVEYTRNQRWEVGNATCGLRALFGTREGDLTSITRTSILANYAEGKSIPVHYDPSDPGKAWVGPPPKLRDAWWALGILFAVFGVLAFGGGLAWVKVSISRRAYG